MFVDEVAEVEFDVFVFVVVGDSDEVAFVGERDGGAGAHDDVVGGEAEFHGFEGFVGFEEVFEGFVEIGLDFGEVFDRG